MIWFSKRHKCEQIIKKNLIHKSIDENHSNSIFFVFLVQKLRSDKHAHSFIKGFPMMPKVNQGTPQFGKVWCMVTFGQTNKQIIFILICIVKNQII